MRQTLRFAAIASVLLLISPSRAAPDQDDLAEAALRAVAEEDVATLAALGSRTWPDAWLLAFDLCVRGKPEVARRLAEAAPKAIGGPLLTRIDQWVANPLTPSLATRWRTAEEAFADEEHETALGLYTALEREADAFLEALCEIRLARVARALDREDALEHWLEVREIAGTLGWQKGERWAAYEIGDLHRQRSEYEAALRYWGEEVEIQTALDDAVGAARARMNLGILHAYLGNPRRAATLFESCLTPLRDAGDEAYPVLILNTARLHLRAGEFDRALGTLGRARQFARKAESPQMEAHCDLLAGEVHLEIEHVDRALEHVEAACAAFEAQGDAESLAQARGDLAIILRRRGEYEEAGTALERTRAWYLQAKDVARVGRTDLEFAKIRAHQGNLDKALEHGRAAIDASVSTRDRELETNARRELGRLHCANGSSAEALASLRAAVAIAEEDGYAADDVKARIELSQLLLDLGRTDESIAEARTGMDVLRTVFNGLADQEAARARESMAGLFEAGMRAAAKRNDAEAFLHFLEGGRAGALLESLSGRDAIRDAAVSPDLLADLDAAHAILGIARKRFAEAQSRGLLPPTREAAAGVEAAKKAYTDVHDRFQREVKAAAGLLFFPEPAKGAEIRRALRPTDVLVEYALLTDDVYAFVLTAQKQRIVPLGPRADLEARIEGAQWDDEHVAAPAAAGLRALLVEPLDLPPTATRVLVAPDGVLFRVPLALLFEQDELWHVASATTWLHQSREKRRRGVGVLAVGDPYYAGRLERLEESGDEARAVGTKVLLGSEATEAALREALGAQDAWRAIHFACHGTVDMQHPLHSALELTTTEDDDGRLTVGEMFDLPFEADLVALSACDSGTGGYYRGEGLIGLTRAITLAGAPRVLCSLWAVEDKATRRLMEKFYELWAPRGTPGKGGMSAAAALRQAQAWMRSQPKWAHPCYWAAWTLWGAPD